VTAFHLLHGPGVIPTAHTGSGYLLPLTADGAEADLLTFLARSLAVHL
jgi:hypothetical protein